MIVHRRTLAVLGHELPILQAMAVLAMRDLNEPETENSGHSYKDCIPFLVRVTGG
jgi:hypothetical protein